MADERDDNDRTQDPTPKRLEEAIRRGDVVKSVEVNTWFLIAGGTLMIMVFAAPMASSLQATFRALLAQLLRNSTPTGRRWLRWPRRLPSTSSRRSASRSFCSRLRPLPAISSSTGWCSRPSRSSRNCRAFRRLAGAARLFSRQALANFAKGLVKLCLIGTVIGAMLWPQRRSPARAHRHRPDRDPAVSPSRSPCGCSAPWSPFSPLSPPPITCSSIGNGSSGRKCRCGK